MDTLSKILALINNKGITEKEFLSDLGLNKSALSDWKKGTTTSYTKHISEIADYFNVSTDYLLGKTDVPNMPEELKGVKAAFYDGAFDGLDETDIDFLKQMAKKLKEKKNK